MSPTGRSNEGFSQRRSSSKAAEAADARRAASLTSKPKGSNGSQRSKADSESATAAGGRKKRGYKKNDSVTFVAAAASSPAEVICIDNDDERDSPPTKDGGISSTAAVGCKRLKRNDSKSLTKHDTVSRPAARATKDKDCIVLSGDEEDNLSASPRQSTAIATNAAKDSASVAASQRPVTRKDRRNRHKKKQSGGSSSRPPTANAARAAGVAKGGGVIFIDSDSDDDFGFGGGGINAMATSAAAIGRQPQPLKGNASAKDNTQPFEITGVPRYTDEPGGMDVYNAKIWNNDIWPKIKRLLHPKGTRVVKSTNNPDPMDMTPAWNILQKGLQILKGYNPSKNDSDSAALLELEKILSELEGDENTRFIGRIKERGRAGLKKGEVTEFCGGRCPAMDTDLGGPGAGRVPSTSPSVQNAKTTEQIILHTGVPLAPSPGNIHLNNVEFMESTIKCPMRDRPCGSTTTGSARSGRSWLLSVTPCP